MTVPEGWRIVSEVPRPSGDLVARFRGLNTGVVCDALGRFGALDHRIKPIGPGMQMVGSALTVRARPCDNLAVYKALEMAKLGDVLLIAVHGYTSSAVWGELTSIIARELGLAGMVTDGAVRDARAISEIGLPVFAQAVTPNSPFKDGPGEINTPVSCGGVVVKPGDIVVGDAEGVVVVPQGLAEAVVARVSAFEAKEAAIRAEIEAGHLFPRQWARLLREKGL